MEKFLLESGLAGKYILINEIQITGKDYLYVTMISYILLALSCSIAQQIHSQCRKWVSESLQDILYKYSFHRWT